MSTELVEALGPVQTPEPLETRSLAYRVYQAVRFWVALAVAVGIMLLLGLTTSVVKSGSMHPTFDTGDVVVTISSKFDQPKVGDVVVAEPEVNGQQLPAIAHRIIIEHPDGTFTTKGDNNPQPDAWRVSTEQIESVVLFKIPLHWAKEPITVSVGIALAVLVIFWPTKKDKDASEVTGLSG